jgi:hypothetical protein
MPLRLFLYNTKEPKRNEEKTKSKKGSRLRQRANIPTTIQEILFRKQNALVQENLGSDVTHGK